MMFGTPTILKTGKYMYLLVYLWGLSIPGSGSIFDPTTVDLVVDIPLTESALTPVPSGVIL
jgi:hypothetical protein